MHNASSHRIQYRFFLVTQSNTLPTPKYGKAESAIMRAVDHQLFGIFFPFMQLLVQEDSLSTAINLTCTVYMSFFILNTSN